MDSSLIDPSGASTVLLDPNVLLLVRELGEICSTWKVQKVSGASAVELG